MAASGPEADSRLLADLPLNPVGLRLTILQTYLTAQASLTLLPFIHISSRNRPEGRCNRSGRCPFGSWYKRSRAACPDQRRRRSRPSLHGRRRIHFRHRLRLRCCSWHIGRYQITATARQFALDMRQSTYVRKSFCRRDFRCAL